MDMASHEVTKAVTDRMLFTNLQTCAMPGSAPTTNRLATIVSSTGETLAISSSVPARMAVRDPDSAALGPPLIGQSRKPIRVSANPSANVRSGARPSVDISA